MQAARRPIYPTKRRFPRRSDFSGLGGDGVQLAQTARDRLGHAGIAATNCRRRPQGAMNRFEATNDVVHGGSRPDFGHGRNHGRRKLIYTQPERENMKDHSNGV
jgi:hypothetical protein